MNILSKLSMVVLLAFTVSATLAKEHNVRPPEGYVPDGKTAIAIAIAVWTPIYGDKQIELQKPYVAKLYRNKWTVTGSTHGGLGGVAIAVIAKDNGAVIRVSHGK